MAVDLRQLLDPKRAEREEGWHSFAQSYERSMAALSDAIEKLSNKRKLDEGESAFTVLERYIQEQSNKAELDREKSQRLHDMVSTSVPEVTAAQKSAYEAQKKLYDSYQDELKKQTKAVEDGSKAQAKAAEAAAKKQIAALDKEEKRRIAVIDAEAAQLKRQQGGDVTKGLEDLLGSGESSAKSSGKDTIASLLLAGTKDYFGKKQTEREKLIDEAAEIQRESIKAEYIQRKDAITEEKNARIEAIREESKARIQEIEKEVKAQAELAGVEKAPESPEEARERLIAETEQKFADNKRLMGISAATAPVVKGQQEFLQKELQQEAMEEQGGEYLSPAVEEDVLPNVATPAPAKEEASAIELAEAATMPNMPAPESLLSPVKSGAAGSAIEGAVGSVAEAAGTVTSGAAGTGSLTAIASGVNAIAPAVAGVALPIALGVKALKDIDDAFPVVTESLGAIGEASRLLGPTILAANIEMSGYLMEMASHIVEGIESALHPLSGTRKEKLEKSGVLETERARVAKAEEEKQRALSRATAESLDLYSSKPRKESKKDLPSEMSHIPVRVESIYTTPADERKLRQGAEKQPDADVGLQQALVAMANAQDRAAQRQAELGQGAVPLQLSTPSLENFNV